LAAKRADVGVVVAAGGTGRRFGGATPKQFLDLGGMPVLCRSIAAFQRTGGVGEIVVVVPAAFVKRAERLIARAPFPKVSRVVPGGRERQESVRLGLAAFTRPPAFVLVHDAARPLVSAQVIRDVIAGTRRYGAAVTGTHASDTIKTEQKPGVIGMTPDRNTLRAVQTPQGFRFRLLVRAHEAAARRHVVGTDDASLVERLGRKVRIVPGDRWNIKITTMDDLRMARRLQNRAL
jgi:2-C-methyl-D-erythritol 4-phosphate cytidylyltransferase